MKKSWIIYVCIVLSIAIVVIGAGKVFLDWMSIEVLKLQTSEAEYSWVNKKPLKLDIDSEKILPRKIEALGIKLSVPWDDMNLIKEDSHLYTFESEAFHIVITREQDLLNEDIISTIIDDKKTNQFYTSLVQDYGQEVLYSPYECDKIVLNTTQDDWKKGLSHKKLDMLYVLISLKCQRIPNIAQTGIYFFEKDSIRGFQIGTGSKVIVWVYNNENEKYQISISRRMHENARIPKSIIDEVNEILPTIEVVNY